MPEVNTVVFDFIGTLTELDNYPYEGSKEKLYHSLAENGYNSSQAAFFEVYEKTYQKYRRIRYEHLTEVTNSVWVSEVLNTLGYSTDPNDRIIQTAVTAFFEDYLAALKLRRSAKSTLKKLRKKYKVGLISNFTHPPVIYSSLKKLGIEKLFNEVLVSGAVGWRKPSTRIFVEALRRLDAEAKETIFVGDTPLEDIQGAKGVGMRTIFIPSQFKNLQDLQQTHTAPDHVIEDLSEILSILD